MCGAPPELPLAARVGCRALLNAPASYSFSVSISTGCDIFRTAPRLEDRLLILLQSLLRSQESLHLLTFVFLAKWQRSFHTKVSSDPLLGELQL